MRTENFMSKTFVLIHGTWHGGWAWQQVADRLSSKGHHAHAPTLAGHGPGAARLGITHRDCVASVVNYIREHGLENITLVGHSFGGTVVQKVAEQVVERIRRAVFLNALVLNDKQCVFDVLPEVFLQSLEVQENGHPAMSTLDHAMQILPPAPWETWRDNFIQDAPESLARSTWDQLSAEPKQVNLDRLDLKQFYSIPIAKSYIFCRQDRAMPPGYFHPRMSSRLGPHNLVEMDGSHEVMFTRPAELADKIIEASSG
jgi:pimeloyl-ACP methyl ester carboxylesterase